LHFAEVDAAVFVFAARTDRDNVDRAPAAHSKLTVLARDLGDQGGADRAQSGDADSQCCGHDRSIRDALD
jgi:hypothetical protein